MENVMVSIRDLYKSFGENQVLKGVSFDVEKGQIVSILGSSGSGKTTLLRCIVGLEKADSGQAFILGKDIWKLSEKQYRKEYVSKIGMVFQGYSLFPHMTVLENVINAPIKVKKEKKEDATDRALKLLEMIGLADKANVYPKTLSGGQAQRVAIARALCMQPEVLLLDEPTSALDPETTQIISDCIKTLAQNGMTIIIVTHHMEFAEDVSDYAIFLEDGSVLEEGAADTFFHRPERERTRQFLKKES